METVLLCGGAGFIGSHIAESYLNDGYKVVVLDDLSTGSRANIETALKHPNYTFIEGSILDKEALERIFKKYKPTIINNHAAQKSVPDSVMDPLKDNQLNIVGLLNLIVMTEKYPIKTFLCASSGGALSKEIMYEGDCSTENDLPQFTSPYALTKYAGEQYLKIYAQRNHYNYIGLRYANVFGPRQVPKGDCGVIPIFVDNILRGKESKLMTYNDMKRGCIREFIYIADVVSFNLLATQKTEAINDVFNIGMGEGYAMLDVYDEIIDAFDVPSHIQITGPREGDLRSAILDSSKAQKTFENWSAKYSLKKGIEELYQFYIVKKE